jgi:hypothetical protein
LFSLAIPDHEWPTTIFTSSTNSSSHLVVSFVTVSVAVHSSWQMFEDQEQECSSIRNFSAQDSHFTCYVTITPPPRPPILAVLIFVKGRTRPYNTPLAPGLLVAYPKCIERNRSDFLRRRGAVNVCCGVEQRGRNLQRRSAAVVTLSVCYSPNGEWAALLNRIVLLLASGF